MIGLLPLPCCTSGHVQPPLVSLVTGSSLVLMKHTKEYSNERFPEPLPGVLGSRGAWAFIFRDIGRSSNYFQGLREPGFRFWGSREIKGTLIFRLFCSVPGLFTCRKAETDKCFSSLSIYKDNFHEGQLTSLTRAIRSLCVMQCIMGKLKHMARHSQDGGREWRQWSC